MKVTILFLLIPVIAFNQSIPKGANTIKIAAVTFKEAAEALLDAGYSFEKADSSFKTIKTEWKQGVGKTKWMKLRFFIHQKDSTLILTGNWYNTMFEGQDVLGKHFTADNSFEKIEYTIGNPKNCFLLMQDFALSFNKPIEYCKQ